MYKLFGIFVALIVSALVVMYFQGGFNNYDPGKVGEETKAAIKVGMTWAQVLDAGDAPGRYQTIIKTKKIINGEEYEEEQLGTRREFDRVLFESDFKGKQMPDGFVFQYVYTQQVAFQVFFDGTGNVTLIENIKTVADLLQTRKP